MKTMIQMSIILLMVQAVLSVGHRYCRLWSCPNNTHTLCKYSPIRLADNCQFPVSVHLTPDETKLILDFHNFHRQQNLTDHAEHSGIDISTFATESLPYLLEWDEELAYIAQTWAYQCENVTDTCRNVDRFNVTQRVSLDLSLMHKREPSIYDSMLRWHEQDILESLNFLNLSLHENTLGSTSRYHLKITWGNANKIGCGIVRTIDDIYKKLYFVCNYGYINYMDFDMDVDK